MKTVRFLFNDEMARAIVEGRKTVTRRPVGFRKLPHGVIEERPGFGPWPFWEDEDGDWHPETRQAAPGDLLIGRECWGYRGNHSCSNDGFKAQTRSITYRADGARASIRRDDGRGLPKQRDHREGETEWDYSVYLSRYWQAWTPSIHMPDWAARIRRRVVSVTVERLQDITEDDAVREGVWSSGNGETYRPALATFADAWDSIYAAKGIGWAANPWVWRIEFSAENVAT